MQDNAANPAPGPWGGPNGEDRAEIETALALLAVGPGSVFVDAGCGGGRFALAACALAGPSGRIAALDSDGKYLGALRREAEARRFRNVVILRADMTRGVPVAANAADACLAAGVLHMPMVWRALPDVFREFARILRPGGRLVVSLRLLRDAPAGPPSPDVRARRRLEDAAAACGLARLAERPFGFQRFLAFQKS